MEISRVRVRSTLVVVAVAAVALTACGHGDPGVGVGGPTVTGSSSDAVGNTAAVTPTATDTLPAGFPSPDGAVQTALLTALDTLVPGIADDPDQAVQYARDVCQQVKTSGDTAAQQFAVTQGQAEGFTVSSAQAAGVVAAVSSSFCG